MRVGRFVLVLPSIPCSGLLANTPRPTSNNLPCHLLPLKTSAVIAKQRGYHTQMNTALQALKESHTVMRCRLSPPTSPSRRAASSSTTGTTAAKRWHRSRLLTTLDEIDLDNYANQWAAQQESALQDLRGTAKSQSKDVSHVAQGAPAPKARSSRSGVVRTTSNPCVSSPRIILSFCHLLKSLCCSAVHTPPHILVKERQAHTHSQNPLRNQVMF